MRSSTLVTTFAVACFITTAVACGSAAPDDSTLGPGTGGSSGAGAGPGAGGSSSMGGFPTTGGTSSGGFNSMGGSNTGGTGPVGDPTTCEGAAQLKSYVGCDYWPTVVANNVWSIFDYAVVVANTSPSPAEVTVTRAGSQVAKVTVAPGGLEKIYLPWVKELKGPDASATGSATPVTATVGVKSGAYHLVSTRPVTVYQFNALEYQGKGGPPGKSWAGCPGNTSGIGCFSFSNDASILLPSTAMTGNYRVFTPRNWLNGPVPVMGGYFAVTGTQDGTKVTVKVSANGSTLAGAGIAAQKAGGVFDFVLNAGDVVQIAAPAAAGDLSGSLVQGTKPVQVIGGIPCAQIPEGTQACDHLEETVMPAETLGSHYFVAPMTGPSGSAPGYIVRLYGNFDGTKLTYKPGTPAGAPSTINAGQVVELKGTGTMASAFEVESDKDHPFGVGLYMPGADVLDPNAPVGSGKGDPSMSLAVTVEQYRDDYVFLAPDDYDVSYADVIGPMDVMLTLDGAPVAAKPTAIASGYGVFRIKLAAGKGGAHTLKASAPVSLQVMGYGSYTSYQYPGGLNLTGISMPPPEIIPE